MGKLKKFFGASRRIFSKNLCPPWPESVPAHVFILLRITKQQLLNVTSGELYAEMLTNAKTIIIPYLSKLCNSKQNVHANWHF